MYPYPDSVLFKKFGRKIILKAYIPVPVPLNNNSKLKLKPKKQGFGSGSAWTRIHFPSWIRIQYADPDPDPGG